MRPQVNKTVQGFTMIELLISMALGLIVLASVTQFFKMGMDTSQVVSQRAEMQQDVRAAINLVAKDITMAGAGMPTGGVALPYGTGNNGISLFAVDQTGKAWLANNKYLSGNLGTPAALVSNHMYSIIPCPATGMQMGGPGVIAATGKAADAITTIYVDYSFPLNQYGIAFPNNTSITLTPPVPAPVPALPAVDDPATGIKVGDLILMSNNTNGSAIGEVTRVAPGGGTITFSDLDPLNINQSGALSGNIAGISGGANTVAYRVYAITYFIDATGTQTRLMRQVNGQVPVPVADNIIALNFTYDTCDGNTTGAQAATCANISNPIASGYTPNDIHKVNISVMGQSLYGSKSQSMELVTSVSTRNINFKDRYN
jgi:prepilin-type N-terminal cleavage/methylation domain-containing protein